MTSASLSQGASSHRRALSESLGSAAVAGRPIRLYVRYATDPEANDVGFRFDQLTLTNFNLKTPDTQTNTCAAGNQPPVAAPDNSNSPTLGPVAIDVLANDTDPDAGQCLRVFAVGTPANGTVQINFNSCAVRDTITYTPSPSCGAPCADSFAYVVSDQNGGLTTGTVTVSQQPVELQGFKVE